MLHVVDQRREIGGSSAYCQVSDSGLRGVAFPRCAWLCHGGTVAVAVKEHEAEIVGKEADVTDTAEIVTDAAAAAAQKPLELLDAILATRVGPSTIAGAANVVTRNVPLVVLLALIALLFWPSES